MLVLLALMASSMAGSAMGGEEQVARGDAAPAAIRRLEQQRPLPVERGEAALERGAVEAYRDQPAIALCPVQPGGADRSEAIVLPSPIERQEAASERPEDRRRLGGPPAGPGGGGGEGGERG